MATGSTLSDFLAAKALNDTFTFNTPGAPNAIADTLSLADYNSNNSGVNSYVQLAIAAGYDLNVEFDGSLAGYGVVSGSITDPNVHFVAVSGSSVVVSVADYANAPYVAALHAGSGVSVALQADLATKASFIAAAGLVTGSDKVVLPLAPVDGTVLPPSPAITNATLGTVIATGFTNLDFVKAAGDAGYNVKVKVDDGGDGVTTLAEFQQAKADLVTGGADLTHVKFALKVPTGTVTDIPMTVAEFLANQDYVAAAAPKGYTFLVDVDVNTIEPADFQSLAANAAININSSIPLSVTLVGTNYATLLADYTTKFLSLSANAQQIVSVTFPAPGVLPLKIGNATTDGTAAYLANQQFITAAEAAGFSFKVFIDPVTTSPSVVAQLLADPHIGAAGLKLMPAPNPGVTQLDVSFSDYVSGGLKSVFATKAENGGYHLNVAIDPNASAADLAVLLNDTSVTVLGGGGGSDVVFTYADFIDPANATTINQLVALQYVIKIQPASMSVADFTNAFDAANGVLANVYIPQGLLVPGIGLNAYLNLGTTAPEYLQAMHDAGYLIKVKAPDVTLASYLSIQNQIGPDAVVVLKAPGAAGTTAGPQALTGAEYIQYKDTYVALAEAKGHTFTVTFDPAVSTLDDYLLISGDTLATIVIKPGVATLDMTAAEYLAFKTTLVAAVENAGYSLSVTFDPAIHSFADYKVLFKDAHVTLVVPPAPADGQSFEVGIGKLANINIVGSAAQTYLDLLKANGYAITITLGAAGTETELWNSLGTLGSLNSAGYNFSLVLSQDQLDAAAAHADVLAQLGIKGIAARAAGHLDVTVAQLAALQAAGITFNDFRSDVTLQIGNDADFDTSGEVQTLVDNAVAENVDHIDIASNTTIEITDSEASSLALEGINFAADDNVVLHTVGSHLSTTLQGLQAVGVHSVISDAGAVVLSGIGADLGGALPTFNSADNVTLDISDQQVSSVVANAGALHSAGVDHLDIQSASPVNLTEAQAGTLIHEGLNFAADDDIVLQHAGGTHLDTSLQGMQALGVKSVVSANPGVVVNAHGANLGVSLPHFNSSDNVTLQIGAGQAESAAINAPNLQNANVDHLDITNLSHHTPVAFIDVAGAEALVNAGISFAGDDTVAVMLGTHYNTSKTPLQLHDIGIDILAYDATGFADVNMMGPLMPTGLVNMEVISDHQTSQLNSPTFMADHNINVLAVDLHDSLSDPSILGTDGIMDADFQAALDGSGGTEKVAALVDGAAGDMANLIDVLDGSGSQLTTDVSIDGLVLALQNAGIVNINLTANAVMALSDQEVHDLLSADLLSANSAADVDLTIGGATSQVSLAEISDLGVDHVHLTAATTLIDLGDADVATIHDLVRFLKNQYKGPAITSDVDPNVVVLDVGHVDVSTLLSNAEAVTALKLIGVDEVTGDNATHDGTLHKILPH